MIKPSMSRKRPLPPISPFPRKMMKLVGLWLMKLFGLWMMTTARFRKCPATPLRCPWCMINHGSRNYNLASFPPAPLPLAALPRQPLPRPPLPHLS
ncbi:hypothetical protein F5Y16DRAFT_368119 [Xylariaceae sp. FL0255]|nr:hypothetical protein F5Y16DRAFT_368119 [Xylariaceae sp. FL0255]